MQKTAEQCATLREYREEVLKRRQWQIAEDAGVQQPWISQIECGHLPKAYNEAREKIVRAYQLQGHEQDFVRMVRNALRLDAMQKPISETDPLFAVVELTAKAETPIEFEVARQAALNLLARKAGLA